MTNKVPLRLATIGLLVLGGTIASVALLQQLTASKPYSISKQEAEKIAISQVDKEPDRDSAIFPNEKTEAKLVHITRNGMAFITDKSSLADIWYFPTDYRFQQTYQNQYFWSVGVATYNQEDGGSRGYYYFIDANTGRIIENYQDVS